MELKEDSVTSFMQNSSILGTETDPGYLPTSDEKTTAILSHVLCLIPGIGFIAPLIIYLVKKNESSYVAAHAKESLNFQITVLILAIILFISIVGILLLWVLGIINTVLVIVATIKASENKLYRYPFSIRLVK